MRTALITLFYGLSLALAFCAGRGIGQSTKVIEQNDILNKRAAIVDAYERRMLREVDSASADVSRNRTASLSQP